MSYNVDTWFAANTLQKEQVVSSLPDSIRTWLLHKESFMDRLQQHGISDANIKLLEQNWLYPHEDEILSLNLNQKTKVFIREVLIHTQHQHWMYARTAIPKETLTDEEIKLSQLENKPLGSILFSNKQWQRQEFELAYLTENSFWYEKATQHVSFSRNNLWARRSRFHLHNKKLLLTEVFFPDIEILV